MIETALVWAVGLPMMWVFMGMANFDFLPDWMVMERLAEGKLKYFLLHYVALVPVAAVAYFGGDFLQKLKISDQWSLLAAVPLGFLAKYILVKFSDFEFNSNKGADQ